MKQAGKLAFAVGAMITLCAVMLSWHSARSQQQDQRQKDPHEMTNIGVISENVREIYAREVEVCYIEAGKTARGAQISRLPQATSERSTRRFAGHIRCQDVIPEFLFPGTCCVLAKGSNCVAAISRGELRFLPIGRTSNTQMKRF